jgi:hypothetical protein
MPFTVEAEEKPGFIKLGSYGEKFVLTEKSSSK